MPDSIPCPQCSAPAQITERFWLNSTDGPVEHLKIGCLSKHWFTPWPRRSGKSRSPPRIATWWPSRADGTPRSAVHASSAGACQLSRMPRGGADVPALCNRRVPVSELAVRPGRTGRLRLAAGRLAAGVWRRSTGGFFGIGARGRDYRMTTGRWDRGRAIGGNILTRLGVIARG